MHFCFQPSFWFALSTFTLNYFSHSTIGSWKVSCNFKSYTIFFTRILSNGRTNWKNSSSLILSLILNFVAHDNEVQVTKMTLFSRLNSKSKNGEKREEYSQCGNFMIFLSLRFYVKSILGILHRWAKSAIISNKFRFYDDFYEFLHFLSGRQKNPKCPHYERRRRFLIFFARFFLVHTRALSLFFYSILNFRGGNLENAQIIIIFFSWNDSEWRIF